MERQAFKEVQMFRTRRDTLDVLASLQIKLVLFIHPVLPFFNQLRYLSYLEQSARNLFKPDGDHWRIRAGGTLGPNELVHQPSGVGAPPPLGNPGSVTGH